MIKLSISTCAGLLGLCAGLSNKICADIWNFPKLVMRNSGYKGIYLSGAAGDIYNFTYENFIWFMKLLKQPLVAVGDFAAYVSGSTCAGISRANPDRHPFDPRNFLMLEQVRVAKEFMPMYIVWEQVPGLYDKIMEPFRDILFYTIEKELLPYYHIDIGILNAMHYGGGCQDRERVIFLLVRKDVGDPSFPTPSSVQPNQYVSSLIPGVTAYRTKNNWMGSDSVIGTVTRENIQVRYADDTIDWTTIDQKKLFGGFGGLNFNVKGIDEESKHIMLGNSVVRPFGYTLNKYFQELYLGIKI